MGTAYVRTRTIRPPVRVCGGITLELVPPRTRVFGRTARTWTWAESVGARVRLLISCVRCLHTPHPSQDLRHHSVLLDRVAKELGCDPAAIIEFELCLADVQPAVSH